MGLNLELDHGWLSLTWNGIQDPILAVSYWDEKKFINHFSLLSRARASVTRDSSVDFDIL